ncbi:MAG TPA: hypothetical protein VII49_00050 [Rhizomicrobium sp.]
MIHPAPQQIVHWAMRCASMFPALSHAVALNNAKAGVAPCWTAALVSPVRQVVATPLERFATQSAGEPN